MPSGAASALALLEPLSASAAFTAGGRGDYLDVGLPDPEEEARRARRRHRKRVARIVVDHWKAFAAQRLRELAARKHYHRRLLTAAWVAWQAETGAARARMRLAAVHDLKRAFLGLGRCVKAWSEAAKREAQLRSLQEHATEAILQRRSRACLRAWRWRCHYSADMRRRQLQAWYYWCFATLTRALRRWYRWAALRRAKAARAARMDKLHAAVLGRKVFTAWRRRRAYLSWKAAAAALAASFRRTWALRGVLAGWRAAATGCAAAREAASAALVSVAARLEANAAAEAFRTWRAFAAGRRFRRQRARYSLAYMRRWWQLVAMWSWRQQVARERHLHRCALIIAQVGSRVRMALAWSRWALAVEVLQGQRTAELRAIVLLRANWATWRALVEHRAVKRELTRMARQRVGRVVAAAALAVWRTRAAHWRGKAERWQRAVSWHRARALPRLLAGWRREAARLAYKAAAAEAAADHRRTVLLRRAVRVWKRYAWRQRMKGVVVEYHLARMAGVALHGWLGRTRYKARMELNRRRAVRHRYLTFLHSGLHAFRSAVQRRRDKLAAWADLARLHELCLQRRVLAAWRQSYLPATAAKRAVVRRAYLHWRLGLLRRALAGWRQVTARLAAKHEALRHAAGHAALRLLCRVLRGWSDAPALLAARREAKARRAAEAAATLAAARASRLLAAWRDVHSDLVMKRFQEARAAASWRHRLLTRALTCWALHLAHRRRRGLLHARADAALRLRRWRGAMEALAVNAVRRRASRRLCAVAEEHRRTGLLRRGVAALAYVPRDEGEHARPGVVRALSGRQARRLRRRAGYVPTHAAFAPR
ncbi:hypothetical protein GPECTOR_16g668 [Gonium pectorale]|uniref:Sfi1 spindle body domain-containing protein n=1 Tax=Gonium pectorale TaxID=33097 RepID=A0A150GKZ7_GONPE|nr:hypothetical protein GPECTOR_16g668 [Gonium pectorale]|eukprot:KXZ50493.1 hypothetical protein GPECTOR_16g668 [Gonium pectorale]